MVGKLPQLTPTQAADRDHVRQGIIIVLATTLILTVIGVVMVFSATSVTSISEALAYENASMRFHQAQRQLAFALGGIALMVLAAVIPPWVYKKFVWVLFALGVGLQLLVLTPLSLAEGGNTNWIAVGGVILQPGEFLKLAAILFLAVMLGRLTADDMRDWRKVAMPAGAGVLVALGAVLAGKDMGTALVYAIIFATGFWIAGIPLKWVGFAALFGVTAALLLIVLVPSRIVRITDYFQNLWLMPDVYSPTQSDHAMWAFGTGGFGGAGLGASREKWNYLPAAHNDFIFAVIGEELGLGGCIAVIILFCALGWGLYKIATHHAEAWARYFAAMAGIWLVGQALLNMMVVTGVLPVFGVPLPFISQGGSAIVSCLACIGVVISLALRQPGVMESFRTASSQSVKSAASIRSKS